MSASVRWGGGGGRLGRRCLLTPPSRGVVPCIHHEATRYITVNVVDRC